LRKNAEWGSGKEFNLPLLADLRKHQDGWIVCIHPLNPEYLKVVIIIFSLKSEQPERADTPGPSCVSIKSYSSIDLPENFQNANPSTEQRCRIVSEESEKGSPNF
jgi:hypothetical protein